MIEGTPLEGTDKMPFRSYPGGGCSSDGGIMFCSFSQIDWKLPPLTDERKNIQE